MGTACLLCPRDCPFAPFPASLLFWVLGFTTWGHGSRCLTCTVAWYSVRPHPFPGEPLTSDISGLQP